MAASRHDTRNARLDNAFYTSLPVVEAIHKFLYKWMENTPTFVRSDWTFVCPTAGDGRLAKGFTKAHMFDIHPDAKKKVKECSYETLDIAAIARKVVILENPPFSQGHVVKFFNTMAAWPQVGYMALVLPDRFRFDQLDSRGVTFANSFFHCVAHMPLDYGSFERASGVVAQIQCSFQIWERRPSERVAVDIGVDVGRAYIEDLCGDNVYWVKRRNPATTRGRTRVVTRTRPAPSALRPIPVCIRRYHHDPLGWLTEVVTAVWAKYPYHAEPSFHAGCIKGEFMVRAKRAVSRKRRRLTNIAHF